MLIGLNATDAVLVGGGFADLHHPEFWNLGFVEHAPRASEYQAMVQRIGASWAAAQPQ